MKNTALLFLVGILALSSCKEKKNYTFLPESIGSIHSVLVVAEESLWNGVVGDSIRASFYRPLEGLSLVESRLQIQYVPPTVFEGTVKQNRTVFVVALDSINRAHVKSDVYARPQKVGVLKGKSQEELLSLFNEHQDEYVAAFKEIELAETQHRFERSLNKDKSLEESFGIQLKMPSIYKLGKQAENFLWYDRPVQNGTLNLIAYTLPSDAFTDKSSLVQDIVFRRDAVVSENIPGPDVSGRETYMLTEKYFPPVITPVEFSGLKGVEVRGMWEMHNYPMAGPFVSYLMNDKKNDRLLVLEGFVFAPNELKRNLLFELEAIIKTLEIIP